jgi:hypothetical protein
MTIRRNVIFQSEAFNTSEPKDYFINECCFGDDLARWMIAQLQARGIHTEPEPGQEDFGWWLTFRVGDTDYDFILGSRRGENDEHEWLGWIERSAGFFGSLLGARKRGIKPEAVEVIHSILSTSPEISNVRWFSSDDFEKEENGQPTPTVT